MFRLLYLRLKLFRLYKKDYKLIKNDEDRTEMIIEIENLLRLIYTEDSRYFYNQTNWVWCPKCHHDLVGTNSFFAETDHVYYKCSNCSTESKWDFNNGICPILIDYKK